MTFHTVDRLRVRTRCDGFCRWITKRFLGNCCFGEGDNDCGVLPCDSTCKSLFEIRLHMLVFRSPFNETLMEYSKGAKNLHKIGNNLFAFPHLVDCGFNCSFNQTVSAYKLASSAMLATNVTTNISTSQAAASGERQSAAAASASASIPSSSRWIFTHEQLMRVPSIREGMSPEEELKRRRVSASTIHQMADKLNHESRVRISQLCICAAMMHMHRFFVFHSFFKFDPRDIAAACLFLAGKSEECPRKLDHVVRVWWAIKFPISPNLDNNRLHDASQLIVTLENLVLQTIGNIRFVGGHTASIRPDAYAKICTRCFRKQKDIGDSLLASYDELGVRYTAKAIACVCIQMACLWAEFEVTAVCTKPAAKTLHCLLRVAEVLTQISLDKQKTNKNNAWTVCTNCCKSCNEAKEVTVVVSGTISLSGASRCNSCISLKACTVAQVNCQQCSSIQTTPDEAPWYKQVDPTMSLDKLLSRLYLLFRILLLAKEAATPQNPGQPQQQSPQQPSSQQQRQGQNQIAPSIATLPPPPVAPQLNAAVAVKGAEPARRIDLSDYKLRNNAAHQQQQPINSQNSVTQTQRRNFMRPDVLPQIAGKGLDLPLPPIIANGKCDCAAFFYGLVHVTTIVSEKQLNQSKSEQVTAKPTEATKIVQISKSGTPKPTTSQKPAITNTAKPLHPLRQLAGTSSHHRKRFHENNMVINQTDNCSIVSATPLTNVSSTPKSGTPKATERQNPTMSVNHIPSGGYSVTSRSRDEATPQSLKRDSNTTSSNNRGRDESTPRQRDDIAPVKRTRQTAPLIALLPTPPSANATPVMSTSSQNSKYSLSTLQTSRSNHIGEGTHRANATTNWSVANDYYMGSSSNNTSRFSQSSGSSNHRHYSSSNTGRTKSREPLLNTPDTGNSYYKRSCPRLSSPTTATTSNAYRQSQRPSSPGNRSGSSYSSFTRCYCRRYIYKITPRRSSPRYRRGEWKRCSWRSRMPHSSYTDTSLANASSILATLPPPPLPPPNEELEDGEVL
ncbi:hypothetical protein DINM_001837 [Dirofilaria immitis]|nr:hypothetical protein [Dirofilaria immitis]